MTPAELSAKVDGYVYNRDTMSANFRALFTLQFNQYAKHPKNPDQLWPLSWDSANDMTMDEIYERNKRIIEAMESVN